MKTMAARATSWRDYIAGGAVFLLPLVYFAALAPYGLNVDDEGTLLYQIYRVYSGEALYVDFHAGYTPGIFFWNAALFVLCGVNVVALRLGLAVVNALSASCLYWLARRLGAGRLAAGAAGFLYVAFIPFYDGQFAAFNIPYPIWYVTLFWLLSVVCAVRWWESGRGAFWLLAGLASGAVFSFKPNSGLLDLAVLLIALVLLQTPLRPAGARPGRVRRVLARLEFGFRWLIPSLLTLSLSLLFARGAGAGQRELLIFALPMILVVGYWLVAAAPRAIARRVPSLTVWRDLLLLGVGFALVTVPWSAVFLTRMGTRPFLRAILFVGTNFDRFYYLPYPRLGAWEAATAAVIVVVWGVALAMNRRVVAARLVGTVVGAAIAGVAFVLFRHPPAMVEGFQASVDMRWRAEAFGLILIIEWSAILVLLVQARRHGRVPAGAEAAADDSDGARRSGTLLAVLLSGVLMHMQLYPRTDFMHLVPAAPGILVLGAWLLHLLATHWGRGMAKAPVGQGAVALGVIAPVYGLILILVAPALGRIEYMARAWWRTDAGALVRLASPRAPLVIEPAASGPFRSLSDAARYLSEHSNAQDGVFTFPALDLVLFLADRQNPTRHGYFFPGWPGHEVEAEVIDALRARPPRFIVTLHGHALFFIAAPVYYFNLRQFVTTHYVLDRHFGTLDVLRPMTPGGAPPVANGNSEDGLAETIGDWRADLQRRGTIYAARLDTELAKLPAPTPRNLADALRNIDDPEALREALGLIRKSRSAGGAAALAMVVGEGGLTPTLQILAMRIIAAVGDLESVIPLITVLRGGDLAQVVAAAGDLFTIASRSWIEEYWYAPSERREFAEIEKVIDVGQLIQWIDNPWELPGLRSFAIRLASHRSDPAVIPFLVRLLGDSSESPFLRTDAAQSLVSLGIGPQVMPAIGALLPQSDLVPAVLLVALYPQAPEAGRALIAEAMQAGDPTVRAKALWMTAAVGDRLLIGDVLAHVADPAPEVRIAAAWTLGELRAAEGVAALQQLRGDADDVVAQYAVRALGTLARAAAAPERERGS